MPLEMSVRNQETSEESEATSRLKSDSKRLKYLRVVNT